MNLFPKNKTNNCTISFPCIYPVCPISIDHARMYVIGDVYARYYRAYNKKVIFPIGFHYSGLTAHKFHVALNSKEENDTKRIFREIYKCHPHVINYLKQSPCNILDYFAFVTLQDFKKINISADYEEYYTTNAPQYDSFVRAFFKAYETQKVIIENKDNIQLDYNNEEWKNKMLSWSEKVSIIRQQEKVGLLNSANDLQNGWDILKKIGYGVKWCDGRIIDPMHDSELLSLYDIVNHVSKNGYKFTDRDMEILFSALSGSSLTEIPSGVTQVLSWLPTSLLIMEEHLKVWFIKKLYTETLLFDPCYRTKNFFVLGLGLKNGKRMSSSRGTAVLLQDLISQNGTIPARMIILMSGGHPSSFYDYDDSIPAEINKLFLSFKHFVSRSLVELLSTNELVLNDLSKDFSMEDVISKLEERKELLLIFNKLEKYIEGGYLKQCLTELMTILPKTFRKHRLEDRQLLLLTINYYLKILLGVSLIEL
ncbi:MAG: Leucyl-tRNA synthetase 2 [uncultured bacterium]|nr:MAG: Leucyl-tRNA synthetase 2 [uncultured bacterium]